MQEGERQSSEDRRTAQLSGFSALLIALLAAIWSAAFAARQIEHYRLHQDARAAVSETARRAQDLTQTRYAELDRLASALAVEGSAIEGSAVDLLTDGHRAALTTMLLERLPGIARLQWWSPDGELWSSVPERPAPELGALENPRIAPTFLYGRRSREPQTTPPVPEPDGRWVIIRFTPILSRTTDRENDGLGESGPTADNPPVGFLGAVFSPRDLLDESLAGDRESYEAQWVYDGTVIYDSLSQTGDRSGNDASGAQPNDYLADSVRIDGHRHTLRLRPRPETLPGLLDPWPWLVAAHLVILFGAWAALRISRRQAERRAHAHLMQGVFSNLPVTAFTIAPSGEVERSFGKAAVGLGLSSRGGETLDAFPSLIRPLQRALAGESVHLETDLMIEGGDTRTFELFLLHDEMRGGGALGFAIDISARKWVEKALQRNEERYRRFFREAPFAYLAVDLEGRIELANNLTGELTGYAPGELAGLELERLFADPHSAPGFVPWSRAKETRNHEVELLRADGSTFWGSLSVQPLRDGTELVGSVLIILDITQRKQLQEQVRQSQKMEAVGRLAGGIAHDFNNLLTAIMGYARMALERLESEAKVSRNLKEIQKACRRATSLISQLLAFSRRQIVEPKVFDMNELLRDMDPMLRRLTREEVDLASHLARDLGHVRLDPGQMEQVIVNLVVNAQEAIEGGGWVTVETDNHQPVDSGFLPDASEDWVRLRISDTGSGMSPEVQEHIFEPFFTTKEDLSGTGLGLATVYGIVVEQSSGKIVVDSELGKGTTISILLPRVYEAIDLEDEPHPVATPTAGHERILLVEDEEMVRELAAEMLSSLGYEVLQAKNGLDALDLVAGREQEIDLLLTDVVMPKMGGERLYLELRQRHPELRVLYSSGYTESSVIHHGVKEGEVPFVHKPYTFDALAQAVRSILNR